MPPSEPPTTDHLKVHTMHLTLHTNIYLGLPTDCMTDYVWKSNWFNWLWSSKSSKL